MSHSLIDGVTARITPPTGLAATRVMAEPCQFHDVSEPVLLGPFGHPALAEINDRIAESAKNDSYIRWTFSPYHAQAFGLQRIGHEMGGDVFIRPVVDVDCQFNLPSIKVSRPPCQPLILNPDERPVAQALVSSANGCISGQIINAAVARRRKHLHARLIVDAPANGLHRPHFHMD